MWYFCTKITTKKASISLFLTVERKDHLAQPTEANVCATFSTDADEGVSLMGNSLLLRPIAAVGRANPSNRFHGRVSMFLRPRFPLTDLNDFEKSVLTK